jgi:hypothetical protein
MIKIFNIKRTDHVNSLAFELQSGDGEESNCRLRISFGYTYISINLPPIIKPHKTKVIAKSWDAETIKRLGRNWYYNYAERIYGFYLHENYLRFNYGRNGAHSESDTEQGYGFFIPWMDTRIVRHTLYNPDHTVFRHLSIGRKSYELNEPCVAAVPKHTYNLIDYDGEEIKATCYLEEREWHYGTGYFKWISYFRKPIIVRRIEIEFDKGTGTRKNHSWKGGITSTSFPIEEYESMSSAMLKYCKKHGMKLVGCDHA